MMGLRTTTVATATEALKACRGNITKASEMLGITRATLYRFIEENPELEVVRTEAREAMIDVAEDKLTVAVERGELKAVMFYLRTQGKERGYTERQEVTGKDGGALVARQEAASLQDLTPEELSKLTQMLLAQGK